MANGQLPVLKFTDVVPLTSYQQTILGETPADKGLRVLYEATNWVVHKLQPREFPDSLLSNEALTNGDTLWQSVKRDYKSWLTYDQGLLAFGGTCVLVSLIFLLISFLVGCCICCCSRRKKDSKLRCDTKYDSCRRRTWNVVLAVLTVIVVFAVVCCWISNEFTHNSMKSLPGKAKNNVDDLALYREETLMRFNQLLVTDYATFERTVLEALNGSSDVLVERVKSISGAVSIDLLSAITTKAETLESNLTEIVSTLTRVMDNVKVLQEKVANLSLQIQTATDAGCLGELTTDQKNSCDQVKQAISQAQSRDDFRFIKGEVFDSLNKARESASKIVNADIAKKLREGRATFDRLRSAFDAKLADERRAAGERLRSIGQSLATIQANLSSTINKLDISGAKNFIDTYQDRIKTYELYRWIGSLVICSILTLMALCLGLGLIFGICGKRPSYYEEDYCCNRRVGAKFYCIGITFGVMLITLLMVIVVALQLIGSNVENIGCVAFKNPSPPTGAVKLAGRYFDILRESDLIENRDMKNFLADLTLSELIDMYFSGCAKNESLYQILRFEKKFDVDRIRKEQRNMKNQLGQILDQVKQENVNGNFHQLISPEVRNELIRVENTPIEGVDVNILAKLKVYSRTLKKENFILELERGVLARGSLPERAKQGVMAAVAQLKTFETDHATPLAKEMELLANNVTVLNESLHGLTKDIPELLAQLLNAEKVLNSSNLTAFVSKILHDLGDQILSYVDQYADHVESKMKNEVTSCEPLRGIAKSFVINMCDQTLYPFNAFWGSAIVCLLLLIPGVWLSFILRRLYLNTEGYTGSDYVSGAGSSSSHSRAGKIGSRSNGYIREYDYYAEHYSRPKQSSSKVKSNGYFNASTAWTTTPNRGEIGFATTNSNGRSYPSAAVFDAVISPPPPYNPSVSRAGGRL